MSDQALLRDALVLPAAERAELALKLMESLDGESTVDVEAAWAAEVTRRVEALRRGEAQSRPAAEVFHAARERLANRR